PPGRAPRRTPGVPLRASPPRTGTSFLPRQLRKRQLRPLRWLERQRDGERGSFTHLAHHLDIAAVRLDNPIRHRQSKPPALTFRLGGEKRMKDLGQILRWNSLAVVRHHQAN